MRFKDFSSTYRRLFISTGLRCLPGLFVTSVLLSLSACVSNPIRSADLSSNEMPTSIQNTPSSVEVFYTTNRAADRGDDHFSGERGETSHGIATVSIPAKHLMGRHEEPSLLKFEWSPDEHKHITLRDVQSQSDEDFFFRLSEAVQQSPDDKLMVFVHGYNVSFDEGARVLAQFANDLKFRGPALLFSWPSRNSLTGYTVDETNAEWATSHFVHLLHRLVEEVPAKEIYLVAHSMGNRIATRGITELASDLPKSYLSLFKELIMIAPDIDAAVFRDLLAPRLARTGIHTTLYASSNDRALRASKAFHGYSRAGDSGEDLVIVDGVETVDASDTEGGFLGHGYFAEDRRIMEDIFALLQTGQRAEQRFGLGSVALGEQRYWTFRR